MSNIAFQDSAFQHFFEAYVLHPSKTSTDGMKSKVLKPYKSSDAATTIANQITDTNTVYVIRYNFTCNTSLTIPTGCVLKFEGGSVLGSGTISGQNTKVIASPMDKIFSVSLSISGTWNVPYAYPEWFGADGSQSTANQNLMLTKASQIGRTLVLTQNYYWDYNNYYQRGTNVVMGCNSVIGLKGSKITIDAKNSRTEESTVFSFEGKSNILIENINIAYTNHNFANNTTIQSGTIAILDCQGSLTMRGCIVKKHSAATLNIGGSSYIPTTILYEGNYTEDGDCGIIIQPNDSSSTEYLIESFVVRDNVFYKPEDIASECISGWSKNVVYDKVVIANNTFKYPSNVYAGGMPAALTKGKYKSVVLSGNTYIYCQGVKIGPYNDPQPFSYTDNWVERVDMHNEQYIRSNGFNYDSAIFPSGGAKSKINLCNCKKVNISDSLIQRIEAYDSDVVVNNSEFSYLIEDTFKMPYTQKDEIYNWGYVKAENSNVVTNNCTFSQSVEGYNYLSANVHFFTNAGNSHGEFNNIRTTLPTFQTWERGFYFNIANTRRKNGGQNTPPAIFVDNMYEGGSGDYYYNNGSFTQIDAAFITNNPVKLHLKVGNSSGYPTAKGVVTINFLRGGDVMKSIRIPVCPKNTNFSGNITLGNLSTPFSANAYRQLYGGLTNHSQEIWDSADYESAKEIVAIINYPYESGDTVSVDAGTTGLTLTASMNSSASLEL